MNNRERVIEKIGEAMAIWYGDQSTKKTIREAIYDAIKGDLKVGLQHQVQEMLKEMGMVKPKPKIRKIAGSQYWTCEGTIGNTPYDSYQNWFRQNGKSFYSVT